MAVRGPVRLQRPVLTVALRQPLAAARAETTAAHLGAGQRQPRNWELVTKENYCYGHLSFSGMESARPVVDSYWQYVDEQRGDMNPHRMAFTQLVCLANSESEAEALYYDAVRYFYRNTNRVSRGFVSAPGYRSLKSYRWELERARANPDRDRAYRGELSFREYNEKGFIIAGDPATVRERIREVAKSLRIGQLIVTLHMGNLSEETAQMNTEIFAREVMPGLRAVWGEYPDHWTPARRPAAAAV
jgi:alkanesulfonate monooxygenase SsuD/methylene tetrahydromethanopterin reductase-like flavin-dependent oxidoreductase (luciferase family)